MRLIDSEDAFTVLTAYYHHRTEIQHEALKDALGRVPTIDPVEHGGWIPCSERLPEEKKAVYWVCNDSGEQFECRWTNANQVWTGLTTYWHWNIFDVPQYSKVVAWMPLPEPYKEKEDETD